MNFCVSHPIPRVEFLSYLFEERKTTNDEIESKLEKFHVTCVFNIPHQVDMINLSTFFEKGYSSNVTIISIFCG